MLRVILFHLYVAIMAVIVITTANILSDRYGQTIINSITGTVDEVNNDVSAVKNKVKDWNKKILE